MLVAIEGIDGSGKGTQATILQKRFSEAGFRVKAFSFPRYGNNPFAHAVSAYLNGEFGPADSVSPYLSALLYAGDRFCARAEILDACQSSDLVICDRYVDSNIAHQAAKLPAAQQLAFVRWIESVEFESYAMPRPHLTIFLTLPVSMATQLISRKSARAYTSLAADIHEADARYLEACAEQYSFLAARTPEASCTISCVDGSRVRPIESIADEIWQIVLLRQGTLRASR